MNRAFEQSPPPAPQTSQTTTAYSLPRKLAFRLFPCFVPSHQKDDEEKNMDGIISTNTWDSQRHSTRFLHSIRCTPLDDKIDHNYPCSQGSSSNIPSKNEPVPNHVQRQKSKSPTRKSKTSTGSNLDFGILQSTLLQISIDTMNITSFPIPLDCSEWLKERMRGWIQLSGHSGSIIPASNHTLFKRQPKSDINEVVAYKAISQDTILKGLTPTFYREIEHKDESYIEIEDLLSKFTEVDSRCIMDIKMGTRTFLESEVNNAAKREDLYKKMVEIDPDEPTVEEHQEKAITKLRYMEFRDRESSTKDLGFRIEAAQAMKKPLQKSFKKIKTNEDVYKVISNFLGETDTELNGHLRRKLILRLTEISRCISQSIFFSTHEVIGSSLLIIHDGVSMGAWMIDFAKCRRVPDGRTLDHRSPWVFGNNEDGYLTGLDNIISILDGSYANKSET